MPRGFWHLTRTPKFSMHLTISIETFNWKDTFINLLDRQLSRMLEFRRIVPSCSSVDFYSEYKKLTESVLREALSLSHLTIDLVTKQNYESSVIAGAGLFFVNPEAELNVISKENRNYLLEIAVPSGATSIQASTRDYEFIERVVSKRGHQTVSYTHLTLPTKRIV